jgi:hypothetical protein
MLYKLSTWWRAYKIARIVCQTEKLCAKIDWAMKAQSLTRQQRKSMSAKYGKMVYLLSVANKMGIRQT